MRRPWSPSRRALVAVPLVLVAFAGCVSSGDDLGPQASPLAAPGAPAPFSFFLCTDGVQQAQNASGGVDRCNHRVSLPLLGPGLFDWQGQHGPGNEVSIAVNPLDPRQVIGGAKDYTVSYISAEAGCGEYNVWMGAFWSTDGGVTWGNDLIPGFPGDERPSPLSGNTCNTDPVMAFDDDGTAWYHALNYGGTREDDATGPSPMGGHDILTGSQLYFAKSPDAGATYPGEDITFASVGDNGLIFNDKNWFALQPGGDHMVATWSNFLPNGPVIMFTESHDAGATWTAPQIIPAGTALNTFSVQFSMPQYLPGASASDPSPDIAVIWADFSGSAARGGAGATDVATVAYTEGTMTEGGLVFQPAVSVFPMHPLKSGPDRDGTGPSTYRLSTYPVLAVDATDGPCSGKRYVVWANQIGPLDSDTEVLMRSSDDGIFWTAPIAVNDEGTGDQFMPWIDVDPAGGVHVAWYDKRNDPDNLLLDVYYAYSDDCGATFHPNIRVTETNFDGDLGHHQSGAPFIGDYIGLDTSAISAHIIWADTRHTGVDGMGRPAGSDVYAATIMRDPNAVADLLPST